MRVSVVLATFCPNKKRYDLCERSFSEIHRTGMGRNEYELIVVNNGGIHDKLIETLDADIVIRNSKNLGQALALNAGIAVAACKNLALMDDDLGYKEGWLHEGLKLLNRFPEYAISLKKPKDKYITGVTAGGYKLARNVGGCWILRRGLYEKFSRFGNLYDWGGHWTRNLIRSGSRFVVSEIPYITHLGGNASMRRLDMRRIKSWNS